MTEYHKIQNSIKLFHFEFSVSGSGKTNTNRDYTSIFNLLTIASTRVFHIKLKYYIFYVQDKKS
jgi:hypothetical protein